MRDAAEAREAISALHKEWGELVSLRRTVRAEPFDETAEQDLVDRLQAHREKLHALRETLLACMPDLSLDARPSTPHPAQTSAHN